MRNRLGINVNDATTLVPCQQIMQSDDVSRSHCPSLHAPGFCDTAGGGRTLHKHTFPGRVLLGLHSLGGEVICALRKPAGGTMNGKLESCSVLG